MTPNMHSWDAETDLFAHSVIGYAIERLRVPKDPHWGAHPADELAAALAAGDAVAADTVRPRYLRRSDAELNWEAAGR